jgi:hypothetical protein
MDPDPVVVLIPWIHSSPEGAFERSQAGA